MKIVVGIGSNLGARLANVRAAAAVLSRRFRALGTLSTVVETPALVVPGREGEPSEPSFCNAAIALEVDEPLEKVLDALHGIEGRFGRTRQRRWAPRTLDLDILWSEVLYRTPRLHIPHPELLQRSFALGPLLEVAEANALRVPLAWREAYSQLTPPTPARRVRYEWMDLDARELLRVTAADRADALAHAVSLLAREWYVLRPATLSLLALEVPAPCLPDWSGPTEVDLVPEGETTILVRARSQ